MKIYWDFKVWNHWKSMMLSDTILTKHLKGSYPEFYQSVFRIDSNGNSVMFDVDPPEIKKIVRIEKDGIRYLLPTMYEDQLPAKIIESFECQLKVSDKSIYRYITKIVSKNIPQDKGEQSFKQFIDEYNDVEVSNKEAWTFLKLHAFAAKHTSVFVAICSGAENGKNANSVLLSNILPGIERLGTPSAAQFYDELAKNDHVVVDEITNYDSETLKDIEKYILPMTDGDPTFTKPKMPRGKQARELDMTRKSVTFTYNRVCDISGRWIDDRWGTPSALGSRFPQLLIGNTILSKRPVFTKKQLLDTTQKYDAELKRIAKACSYWVSNLHKHTHGYNRDKIKHLSTRHYACLSGLFDAYDTYSESQEEFDTHCQFILDSMDRYKRMVKQDETVYNELDIVIEEKKPSMPQQKIGYGFDEEIL